MKCKFEHDGDCCNCGASQYLCKCKQPCDTISPMTNADCIRDMTDEELAEFLDETQKMECEAIHELNKDGSIKFQSLVNGWLEWLKQPYGGADHE